MGTGLQQSSMSDQFDVVVVYSGGLDSTTLLYDLIKQNQRVAALSLDYGQRHKRELRAAQGICERLRVRHEILDVSATSRLLAGNALTDSQVTLPEGHYTDETMRATVVPNRNMILLSFALAWAVSAKAKQVAYAAHSGDHIIYPDCRPEFVKAMQAVAAVCDYQPLELLTPYLTLSKQQIVERGAALRVPFADTWSCYVGGHLHCGRCGTCVERQEAFAMAGVADPTPYEIRT